jgi:ankyrin repeat protein
MNAGDMHAVAMAIASGDDLNQTIDLPNAESHLVCGVTPLYLAAQAGHLEVVRVLLASGADPTARCAIPATGDVFSAADIALVHLNLRVWAVLASAVRGISPRAVGRKGGPPSLATPLLLAGET